MSRGCEKNKSLISETSAHFNRLFKTSSSPRAIALEQSVENTVEFALDKTGHICGPHWKPTFNRLIGTKNNFGKIHISQGLNWVKYR